MAKKKAPRDCDAQGPQAIKLNSTAEIIRFALQSQAIFLARQIGAFDPSILAALGVLILGQVRQ